jgi:uncharacterized repeat protein (TIGR01451 family)
MKVASRRIGSAFAAAALLAAGAAVAQGQSKQQRHDEMVSIAERMEAIKGDPAGAAFVDLDARYRQLSASLGGDDPGALLGAAAAPDPRQFGANGVVPPNCVSSFDTVASTDTPLPINDMATTTSTITVSGVNAYLQDLNLLTDITHTFAGDLDITVTSPAGTVVTLTTDNGAGNDNVFAGTLWDDDGGDANPPGAATDNVYANLVVETPLVPEEALAAFIGEDPNGIWTIAVFDDAGADTGTLNSWSLTLTTLTTTPIFDPPVSVTSTDTPLPINDLATTTSTIAFSGAGAFVCEVDVTTDITHTFAGDLEITVTSPGGTVSTMTTDNGAGNDNVFAGTLWDDDGGDTNPPGPATDNVYANLVVETPLVPEEALGAFIGEDPNGNWVLSVFDDAGADTGTLNSWTVDVVTCSCIQPDADLEVTKTGSFDGTTDQITWTITVTNNGPDDATGVVVTDPLDPCTTFVSDDCGGVVVPPWTWNVGALANGANATCNVVVDASACPVGAVSNTATAGGNETDPVPGNEAATASVGVGSILEIPTLGRAGLLLLLLAITFGALVMLRRRSTV